MFIDRLEGQTRGICVQNVLCAGQVVLRMPHYLAGNGCEEARKERDKKWCDMHTFGFEEGRNAARVSLLF